jgi:hypothetical protein
MNDKTRENRLRRLAHRHQAVLHKSRRPFLEGGVLAAYYLSSYDNCLMAVYADLDAAEENLKGRSEHGGTTCG